MSNIVLRKRRVLTIFVAKIHMSHCSPRSYAIITLRKKIIKIKLNRRHEVLAKNITFNDVEQPVLSVKRVAAVQIVVHPLTTSSMIAHLYLRIYYLYDDTAHMICSQTSLTVPRTKLVIHATRSSYTNNHVY